ncbi:MAG: hypothetical protein IJX19_00055 [Clostridia bacterium]|nr:hypothetical protein [Clostridia bacterium]
MILQRIAFLRGKTTSLSKTESVLDRRDDSYTLLNLKLCFIFLCHPEQARSARRTFAQWQAEPNGAKARGKASNAFRSGIYEGIPIAFHRKLTSLEERAYQESLEDPFVALLLGFAPASQNFDYGRRYTPSSAQDDSFIVCFARIVSRFQGYALPALWAFTTAKTATSGCFGDLASLL